MENEKIMEVKTEWNFKKEVDGYYSGDTTMNYVIPRELTVTITLDEYRTLLTSEANKRAREAESDRWERNKKIEDLNAEIEQLKQTINTLMNACPKDAVNNVAEEERL